MYFFIFISFLLKTLFFHYKIITFDCKIFTHAKGVYIHGLFIEGASLDQRTGKLVESKPKVLFEPMPVIFIYAMNTTAGRDAKLYECPIYRKPDRTQTNYIGSIDFESEKSPKHWALRGVALLCDIK